MRHPPRANEEEEWEEDELEEGGAAEEDAAEEPAEIEVRRTAKKKRTRPSAQPAQGAFVQPSYDDYELPPLDLLAEPEAHITPLRGSKLWQVALLELWLQQQGL